MADRMEHIRPGEAPEKEREEMHRPMAEMPEGPDKPHGPGEPHRPGEPHGPGGAHGPGAHGPGGPHPGGPHGPHGPHGPGGPHPGGPHDPGGPHGPHGPHGPGGPPAPHIDWEGYKTLDTDGKLLAMIRALGHASRHHIVGRGGQDRALRILGEGQSMTQRELTERLGIQPGSASELVGKLERAGYIRRTPSGTDRRTADIRLTEAGAARRAERGDLEKSGTAALFTALTEEEKSTLLALLEKLHAAWQEPPAPPEE